MKVEIKFWSIETMSTTIISPDRLLQHTAVYCMKMPKEVTIYSKSIYKKCISDGENSFSVTELVSRGS